MSKRKPLTDRIAASQILELLAARHSQDVFVPECKNGPTQGGGHLRMDAWAMSRSWARPFTFGYEIKVSRSDFLNDKKWELYLPYCSHFSFAVGPGVCEPSELPDGIGLLVTSKNGSRLFTKRKAVGRDIQVPEDIWRYVLMCRAQITNEYCYDDPRDRLTYWRAWLTEKREKLEIGHKVAKAVRERYSKDVIEVSLENHSLERAMKGYDEIKKFCDALGISPHAWMTEERLRDRMGVAACELPEHVLNAIDALEATAEILTDFKRERHRLENDRKAATA